MAKEPNYSREELLTIVESWDEYTSHVDIDTHQTDREYDIRRSDIIKLGTTAAIIWSDLQIILEKDWVQEKEGLETFKDEYNVTWVHMDLDYLSRRYSEFDSVDIANSIQKLMDSSELSFSKDASKPVYAGWYAERRCTLISETVSYIESEINLGSDLEESTTEAMKRFYPSVYADIYKEF